MVLLKIAVTYTLLLFLLMLTMCGCIPKTEFYLKGKPCYTREKCVEYKEVDKIDYHYGLNPSTLKEEYFYGTFKESVCVKTVIDTIIIKRIKR